MLGDDYDNCDVILGILVLILVCMEKGDTYLLNVSGFSLQVHRWVETTPLGKRCYKKRLGKTGMGLILKIK